MNHKLTVSDLPAAVIEDLLGPEFRRIDYYFGPESKHEFCHEWKHFIEGQTVFPKELEGAVPPPTVEDYADFIEIDGNLVLLPLAKKLRQGLDLISAHESRDGGLLTLFFSAKRVPGYDHTHNGLLAIAERYERHGVMFHLGRYVHHTYLVGHQHIVSEKITRS